MARTAFGRSPPPRQERQDRLPALLCRGTGRGVITLVGDDVLAIPKGAAARPGRAAPTAAEAERMARVVAWGCVACRLDGADPRETAIHHLLRGGVRMGHRYTIGLCDPGHHQGGGPLGLVSRHPWKARFEERYGDEMQLLALTDEALGYPLVRL